MNRKPIITTSSITKNYSALEDLYPTFLAAYPVAFGVWRGSPTPHHKIESGMQIPPQGSRISPFTTDRPFLSSASHRSPYTLQARHQTLAIMADSLDYVKICESAPAGDGWGPSVTTETTLDGVPYAPFSKGDKLGRMADWTGSKDGERGGRMQYNRNYRGEFLAGFCAGLHEDKPGVGRGHFDKAASLTVLSTHRSASLRLQPRLDLLRPPRRGRIQLLRRQQHPRLYKVPVRPRRRLHPW